MLDSNQRPRGCEPRALTTEPIAPESAGSRSRGGCGSYIEARPASPDGGGLEPLDLDQLAPARRPDDECDARPGHPHGGSDEPDQRGVGGAIDRRGRDPNRERAVDYAVDPIDRGARCQANRDAGARAYRGCRAPKMARPMRTSVAPSSTATG